ncbi:MAG: hypothetical protein RH862_15850 [Leptospiraceae bacterium]
MVRYLFPSVLIVLFCSFCRTHYVEPSVGIDHARSKESISQRDVVFAGFYNYRVEKSGLMYRLYCAGNAQFREEYSGHHVGDLSVEGRTPVDLQKAANLILHNGLRPAMNEEAIAAQDLQSPRGIYQAVKYLESGGYGDFARLFHYDANTDQLYLNDFGRPYLAVGLHEPTFRRPTFGGRMIFIVTYLLHFLSLGTVPAVWIDPGETRITVYNSDLEVVGSLHLDHSTYALASNWIDGEEYIVPDSNDNPHGGGIPKASAPAVYQFMKSRGDELFKRN